MVAAFFLSVLSRRANALPECLSGEQAHGQRRQRRNEFPTQCIRFSVHRARVKQSVVKEPSNHSRGRTNQWADWLVQNCSLGNVQRTSSTPVLLMQHAKPAIKIKRSTVFFATAIFVHFFEFPVNLFLFRVSSASWRGAEEIDIFCTRTSHAPFDSFVASRSEKKRMPFRFGQFSAFVARSLSLLYAFHSSNLFVAAPRLW